MNPLTHRQQAGPRDNGMAVNAGTGVEEPIEPAYYKPVSASPVAAHMAIPAEPVGKDGAVVKRAQRKAGMRYLWARGADRQPISFLGTGPDIGIATWNSSYQPDLVHLWDAGFNDALYESGYPGFNLGLSFKVPVSEKQPTGGPGYGMRMRSSIVRVTINKVARTATSQPTG